MKGVLDAAIKIEPPPPAPTLLTLAMDPAAGELHKEAMAKWRGGLAVDLMVGSMERWKAVWARYGIAPPQMPVPEIDAHGDPWQALALAMAQEFFPGLHVAARRDRLPNKWTPAAQARLVLAVKKLVDAKTALAGRSPSRGKYSERSACAVLAKQEPWVAMLGGRGTGNGLNQRYKEAKATPLIGALIKMANELPDDQQMQGHVRDLLEVMAQESSTEKRGAP